MIAIYTDSQIQDIEWVPAIHWPEPTKIYHSEREYIASTADYKVAITTHRLHCDWLDANQAAYEGFEEKIIRLSEASDLVFTLESELHDYHWTIWDQCHRPNVYWVQPGLVNDAPEMRANMIYWGDWFKTLQLGGSEAMAKEQRGQAYVLAAEKRFDGGPNRCC